MALAAKLSVLHENTVTKSDAHDDPTRARFLHPNTLDHEDFVLLNSLDEVTGDPERIRGDMAELLMDEETVEALRHYQIFFETGGVDVGAAVETLPRAIRLHRLKRRLEGALGLLQRHIHRTSEPLVSITSDVHRLLAATPEGSAIRASFALFEKNWQSTFRGGRAPTESAPTPTPSTDPTTPR